MKDAFKWIHTTGRDVAHLDPSRLVVAGGSAGGYLAMMTGICVEPKPTALVSYWGYGDLDGAWYTSPSPFYRKGKLISREEALHGLDSKTVTAPADRAQSQARGIFYRYLRQNGLWTREVTGMDPLKEKSKLDPYCPVRNITPAYPPILMIHGDKDEDVPFEKSADMDRALTRHKVPHEFIPVPNGGHGLGGADRQVIADAHARALAFIKRYLSSTGRNSVR